MSPQITVSGKSVFSGPTHEGWYYLPHSALNTTTGETLVVWQGGSESAVSGRIISPQGISTEKKIPFIPTDSVQGCDVAYNPITKEYLLVFHRAAENDVIHALRLDSNANAIGKEFQVVGQAFFRNVYPHVIFNPRNKGYILIWENWGESGINPDAGIKAVLLDQKGRIAGDKVTIMKNPEPGGVYDNFCCGRVLADAFLPSGNKLLVFFKQYFNKGYGDYWLATLDPMLKNVTPSNVMRINTQPLDLAVYGGNVGAWAGTLAILPDGSAVAFYTDNNGVSRQPINLDGIPSGAVTPAFSAPLSNHLLGDPKTAFSTTSAGTIGLLLAQEGDYTGTTDWAQRLDSHGNALSDPQIISRTEPWIYRWGSVLTPVSLNANKFYEFNWLQCLIDGHNDQSTILKLNLDVQP